MPSSGSAPEPSPPSRDEAADRGATGDEDDTGSGDGWPQLSELELDVCLSTGASPEPKGELRRTATGSDGSRA